MLAGRLASVLVLGLLSAAIPAQALHHPPVEHAVGDCTSGALFQRVVQCAASASTIPSWCTAPCDIASRNVGGALRAEAWLEAWLREIADQVASDTASCDATSPLEDPPVAVTNRLATCVARVLTTVFASFNLVCTCDSDWLLLVATSAEYFLGEALHLKGSGEERAVGLLDSGFYAADGVVLCIDVREDDAGLHCAAWDLGADMPAACPRVPWSCATWTLTEAVSTVSDVVAEGNFLIEL